jgi:hypothetical protein
MPKKGASVGIAAMGDAIWRSGYIFSKPTRSLRCELTILPNSISANATACCAKGTAHVGLSALVDFVGQK